MEKKIVGNYLVSDIFTEKYANGAFGGFNGKDFLFNFFVEKQGIPHQFEVNLNDNGQVVGINNIGASRVREVHTSIIVNYEVAKSIHEWLGKNLENFENAMKKVSGQN